MFESIAKTNTTHTITLFFAKCLVFESIAKTNTTHTVPCVKDPEYGLRVLLKQIQHTPDDYSICKHYCLRVLLKQIQHTHLDYEDELYWGLRVLLKQIQHTQKQCNG